MHFLVLLTRPINKNISLHQSWISKGYLIEPNPFIEDNNNSNDSILSATYYLYNCLHP